MDVLTQGSANAFYKESQCFRLRGPMVYGDYSTLLL